VVELVEDGQRLLPGGTGGFGVAGGVVGVAEVDEEDGFFVAAAEVVPAGNVIRAAQGRSQPR